MPSSKFQGWRISTSFENIRKNCLPSCETFQAGFFQGWDLPAPPGPVMAHLSRGPIATWVVSPYKVKLEHLILVRLVDVKTQPRGPVHLKQLESQRQSSQQACL